MATEATATPATRKRRNGRNGAAMSAHAASLREDIEALQKDVGTLVNDAGGVASEQVQGAVKGAIDSASEAVERIGAWSTEELDGVRHAVRTRPLWACVLAASAGAIIGAFLLR